jgi:hypothetical protein
MAVFPKFTLRAIDGFGVLSYEIASGHGTPHGIDARHKTDDE